MFLVDLALDKLANLKESNLKHMPKNGRQWDYSDFDDWLAQKKIEFDC